MSDGEITLIGGDDGLLPLDQEQQIQLEFLEEDYGHLFIQDGEHLGYIDINGCGCEDQGTLDLTILGAVYRGESLYQMAVRLGFTGTEEEFLLSLVGPESPNAEEARAQADRAEAEADRAWAEANRAETAANLSFTYSDEAGNAAGAAALSVAAITAQAEAVSSYVLTAESHSNAAAASAAAAAIHVTAAETAAAAAEVTRLQTVSVYEDAQGALASAEAASSTAVTMRNQAEDFSLASATHRDTAQGYASDAGTAAQAATEDRILASSYREAADSSADAAAISATTAASHASDALVSATASQSSRLAAEVAYSGTSGVAAAAVESASEAEAWATAAGEYANAASTDRVLAETASASAAVSATNSATAEENAEASASAAASHELNAEAAKADAETAAAAAVVSSDSASASSSDAAASALAASTSALNAEAARDAADGSAAAAALSATSASASATDAGNSATAAENSSLSAATSSTNAATSATNADSSADSAAGSATAADASADAAALSEAAALTYASNASVSESAAATSASNAAGSASTASTQATLAATSATNAGNSATAAATSASSASTSATAAANSATSSSNSSVSAQSSAAAALTQAMTLFPDRLDATASYFTDLTSGAPATSPMNAGTITARVIDLAGYGPVFHLAASGTGSSFWTRGTAPAAAGRVYELEVEYEVTVYGAVVTFRQYVQGLSSSFAALGTLGSPNTGATAVGIYTMKSRFSDVASTGVTAWVAGAVNLRFGTNLAGGIGTTVYVRRMTVKDVTATVAAEVKATEVANLSASLFPETFDATGSNFSFTGTGAVGTQASLGSALILNEAGYGSVANIPAATYFYAKGAAPATSGKIYEVEVEWNVTVAAATANLIIGVQGLTSTYTNGGSTLVTQMTASVPGIFVAKRRFGITAPSSAGSAWPAGAVWLRPAARTTGGAGNTQVVRRMSLRDVTAVVAAENQYTNALLQVATILPERLDDTASQFTTALTGTPISATAVPAADIVNDATYGYVYQKTAASAGLLTRGTVPAIASKVYEVIIEWEITANPDSNAVAARVVLQNLSATHTSAGGSQIITGSTQTAVGVYTNSARFSNVASTGITAWNGAAIYLRFGSNFTGFGTSTTRTRRITVRDVTALVAAEAQAATATTRVSALFPETLDATGTYFTDTLNGWGDPSTVRVTETDNIVSIAGYGFGWQQDTPGSDPIYSKGTLLATSGKVYEVEAEIEVVTYAGTAVIPQMTLGNMTSTYANNGGVTTVSRPNITAAGIHKIVFRWSDVAPVGGGAWRAGSVYIRPGFFYGSGTGSVVQLRRLRVTDVTTLVAAEVQATAAATSASAASTSASAAGTSATASQTSATNAATSAGNAATSATAASTSATNASGSANSASTSATAAATSATAASGSATAAATSATNAATSATDASNSATSATNSANTASTHSGSANTSAINAASSASAASTSATNAATSATTATTQATAATTQATNAANSLTSARTVLSAVFPERIDATASDFTSAVSGAPFTGAALNSANVVTEAGYGLVYNLPSGADFATKGAAAAASTRIYEIEVELSCPTYAANANPTVRLYGLNSSYTVLGSTQVSFAPVNAVGVFRYRARFGLTAEAGATTEQNVTAWFANSVWLRPMLYFSGGAGTTVYVRRFTVKEVSAAVVAERSATAAFLRAVSLFPDRLNSTGSDFTTTTAGDERAGATLNSANIVNEAGYGFVYQLSVGSDLNSRGFAPAVAGRVYEIEAEFSVAVYGTSGVVGRVGITALNSAYAALGQIYANVTNQTGVGSASGRWRFSNTAPTGGSAWTAGAVWLRATAQYSSGVGATVYLRRLTMKDVTALAAAETSAAGAATSATNAATSATAASTSASTASTQATVANTHASAANTSATAASGSATASAGSASAAAVSETNADASADAADASATAAAGSASSAANSATNAATSATNAAGSASSAATSATSAAGSATNAGNSATAASTSASGAATSATNAGNSAAAAATSETNAANSATNASNSASAAATSASGAATSATNAGNSATAANTSAVNAASSFTAADTAATNAAGSATAAAGSATAANNSATAAATSASGAATSATAAGNSATAANTSAVNAASSYTAANTSAGNAATSATNSANSATAAGTSATNASTSATAAGASATSATTSANTATTQAGNASTSATAAATSATAASASATAASNSAVLAASVGLDSINKNPVFVLYPTTPGLPTDWINGTNGTNGTRVTGQNSSYAYSLAGGAGAAASMKQRVENQSYGWYVLEADVTLGSGALTAAGLILIGYTSNTYATPTDTVTLAFAVDKDVTDSVIGSGTVGRTYRFRKLVQMTTTTTTCLELTVAAHSSTLGSQAAANTIVFHRANFRPASQAEIAGARADTNASTALANIAAESSTRAAADTAQAASITTLNTNVAGNTASISTQATAISNINGRVASTYAITVGAGNRFASMKLLTESGGGTEISTFDVQADKFRIYNDTTSNPVFEVSGGVIYIGGDMVRTGSIETGAAVKITAHQSVGTSVTIISRGSPSGHVLVKTMNFDIQSSTSKLTVVVSFAYASSNSNQSYMWLKIGQTAPTWATSGSAVMTNADATWSCTAYSGPSTLVYTFTGLPVGTNTLEVHAGSTGSGSHTNTASDCYFSVTEDKKAG